jgi:hypothetical protein
MLGELLEESHTLFYSLGMKLQVHNGKSHIVRCEDHPSGETMIIFFEAFLIFFSDSDCGWDDKHEGMIIIASEPLSTKEQDFIAVPPNHMIIANQAKSILSQLS